MGRACSKTFFVTLLCAITLPLVATDIAYGGDQWYGRYYGRDLNGIYFNSPVLEDRILISISLNQVQTKHKVKKSVRLKKAKFKGIKTKGAIFTGTLDDGSSLSLRIDDMQKGEGKFMKDVHSYSVSYLTEGNWQPLCGLDEQGKPITAIPLSGFWNYEAGVAGGGSHIEDDEVFTFACNGYVLAKCVMAGYKPWGKAFLCDENGRCKKQNLAPYHQACTRLLRADYCGDGTPYTVDGVWINMYDGIGIRIDVNQWIFEAEWDQHGAVCVSTERITGMVPDCMEYLQQDECGDFSHLFYGTLLFSEIIHDE